MAVSARIQQIYLALFGRPADPVGGAFYDTLTNNGADLAPILTGNSRLSGSTEYLSRFAGENNTQIIETIYNSLFGHNADLAGLTFYTQTLANGDAASNGLPLPFPDVPAYTIEQIAVGILDGATGTDAAIIANKTAAAVEFTGALDTADEVVAYQGGSAADFGRSFVTSVTADPASVPPRGRLDAALATWMHPTDHADPPQPAPPEPSADIALTVAADTVSPAARLHEFRTTASDDVIRASVSDTAPWTINSGDNIDGGQGWDTLVVEHLSGDHHFVLGTTLSNVEQISISNPARDLDFDTSTWTGLKVFEVSDNSNNDTQLDNLHYAVKIEANNDFGGAVILHFVAGALSSNQAIDASLSNSGIRLVTEDPDAAITTLKVHSLTGTNNFIAYTDYDPDDPFTNRVERVIVDGPAHTFLRLDNVVALSLVDASANVGGFAFAIDSSTTANVTAIGSDMSDDLRLSDGADTLRGGGGGDTMFGGSGADSFVYLQQSDSTQTAPDTISDFASGEDKIDVSAVSGFNHKSVVTVATVDDLAAAIASHDAVFVVNSNTLYLDAGGFEDALDSRDMAIVLTGVLALQMGDVIFAA